MSTGTTYQGRFGFATLNPLTSFQVNLAVSHSGIGAMNDPHVAGLDRMHRFLDTLAHEV
jgi:hypothetical protein